MIMPIAEIQLPAVLFQLKGIDFEPSRGGFPELLLSLGLRFIEFRSVTECSRDSFQSGGSSLDGFGSRSLGCFSEGLESSFLRHSSSITGCMYCSCSGTLVLSKERQFCISLDGSQAVLRHSSERYPAQSPRLHPHPHLRHHRGGLWHGSCH